MPPPDVCFMYAVLAVLLAGLVRGFAGFGAGMILAPVLALLYGPVAAVVSVVLLEAIPAVQLLPSTLPHADWRSVIPMSLAAVVAIPLGSLFLINVDAGTLRMIISLSVIGCVLLLASGWRIAGNERSVRAPLVTGVLSGVIGGATSLGGLPVVLYYLSGLYNAVSVRASLVMFLVVSVIISIITYTSIGIITREMILRCVWLMPFFVVAIWAGKQLFGRVSESAFRVITLALVGGIGVVSLCA
jgi:uncharacterized membrane protein YfcA